MPVQVMIDILEHLSKPSQAIEFYLSSFLLISNGTSFRLINKSNPPNFPMQNSKVKNDQFDSHCLTPPCQDWNKKAAIA